MFSLRIAGLSLQEHVLWQPIALAHTKICSITMLSRKKRALLSKNILNHTKLSPTRTASRKIPACDVRRCKGVSKQGGSPPGDIYRKPDFSRRICPGSVRYGFIPEEWFTFFYPHTGVSGPYVFGLVLLNYWVSKEIYVMEHEYYLGLSFAVVTYYVATKFGPAIGASIDSEIEAIEKDLEKGRKDERDYFESIIKSAEGAQARAKGQELLMAAKKENIAMQLEAAYRERMMLVYSTTKGRLDYHMKKHRALNRIHQRWMIEWILRSVRKSITPEFEQQALDAAIRDLSAVSVKL